MDFNVFGDDEEADEIAFYLDWDRNYVWSYINEFGRLPPLPTPPASLPEFSSTNDYHPYFLSQLQRHENNIQNLDGTSPPEQTPSGNLMTYHHPNTIHNDISTQQQQQQNNHTSVETVHPEAVQPEGKP
uniref:Uncharacterized protein n=1 Tax=Panagrolaimus davidi TaxID=227884 RepID=A0A914P708_9BILA